jgi:hypothetical protein
MMRRATRLAAALAAASILPSGSAAAAAGHGIRTSSANAKALVEQARRQSPTVEALAGELARSDLFVYVDFECCAPGRRGRTNLLAATPHGRYVRVAVHAMLPTWERIEVLAHELQHAVEVARAPEVHDQTGMRALFRRIGWMVGPADFETRAAMDVERLVRADLGQRPSPRPS